MKRHSSVIAPVLWLAAASSASAGMTVITMTDIARTFSIPEDRPAME